MTTGELLKEYRISQAKSQKEFINNGLIVSQSYYSKVEKNINKITVDNLVELLHYNNIPVWEFFSRLNSVDETQHDQVQEFEDIMYEAYFDNDLEKMNELRRVIEESDISEKVKEDELLQLVAFIQQMKDPNAELSDTLKEKIKQKIFDIPNYNKLKVTLFNNYIYLYDFETQKMMAQQIVKQHINSKDIKMQDAVLSIIENVMAFSIKYGQEKEVGYFIESGEKIKTSPELVFTKTIYYFFKNLIDYRITGSQDSYQECNKIRNFLASIGMTGYSEYLEELLSQIKSLEKE